MPEPIVTPAGPALNEHGYPDATPVVEMEATHQAAYWKHHARKHEQRAAGALDAAEVQRLRDRDAALKTLEDAQLTDSQRIQAEKDVAAAEAATAKAEAEKATRRALLLEIALTKKLTVAQAERLRGATKEELEADADAYLVEVGGSGAGNGVQGGSGTPRSGGNRGGDVGGSKATTATGADLYRERHNKN